MFITHQYNYTINIQLFIYLRPINLAIILHNYVDLNHVDFLLYIHYGNLLDYLERKRK